MHLYLGCIGFWSLEACSPARLMMPTPNFYVDAEIQLPRFDTIAPELKNREAQLFYLTNRAPEQGADGKLSYGYSRSASIAFGKTIVDLGTDLEWGGLVVASRTNERLRPVKLAVSGTTELVRTPNTPLPYREVNSRIVEEPRLLAQLEAAKEGFRKAIVLQLSLTPRKEIFIYAHGFNNDFYEAAFSMAQLWHFVGRIGVPIIYTWPAGHPGLFGYTYDL